MDRWTAEEPDTGSEVSRRGWGDNWQRLTAVKRQYDPRTSISNPQSDDPALGPAPLLLYHRNQLSNSGNVFRVSVRNSPSKRPTNRFSNVMRIPIEIHGPGRLDRTVQATSK
jgi:hypothetical protein